MTSFSLRPSFLATFTLALVLGTACGGTTERDDSDETSDDSDGIGGSTGGETGGSTGDGDGDGDGAGGRATGGSTSQNAVNGQLDLLFVVDNSGKVGKKQELLQESIESFLSELLTQRDGLTAIDDVHVGVITSSLGGHGSDTCARDELGSDGAPMNNDDRGRLLPSVRPGSPDPDGTGFLSWSTGDGVEPLAADLAGQIAAVGTRGCGFEAPLEAMYRFLTDPTPPEEIVMNDSSQATIATDANGNPLVDELLLAQRDAFLRPHSTVAVVLLTDEDDCSLMDGGTYYNNSSFGWLVSDLARPMKIATPICDSNPNDACCFSCLQAASPPAGCDASACDAVEDELIPELDRTNVRCHDTKRRFGVNLLYPLERYVEGLVQGQIIEARTGMPVNNPLMRGVGQNAGRDRNPDHVIFAGIVGVPWQDVATDESLTDPETLSFLDATELSEGDDRIGASRWVLMLGVPNLESTSKLCPGKTGCGLAPVPPVDPFMIASIAPRVTGLVHPLTGDSIVASDSLDPRANGINGHEANHSINEPELYPGTDPANDDLQAACLFQLKEPIVDCTTEDVGCDCATEPSRNRPQCQPPEGGEATTTQTFDKAYPSARVLQVLKELGPAGVTTSACPKITEGDAENEYYGYNPALKAVADRIWSIR